MELLRKWLGHPEDIYNLLRFKMGGYRAVMPRMDTVSSEGCAGGGMRFAVAGARCPRWGAGHGRRGRWGDCHVRVRIRCCHG